MGMRIGYARASSSGQKLDIQLERGDRGGFVFNREC